MKLQKFVCTVVLGALTLGVTAQTSFATAARSLDGEGTIKYTADNLPVSPIDPEIPGEEVIVDPEDGKTNPELGELRLDLVTHLRFGEQVITTKEKEYFAKPVVIKGAKDNDNRTRGNYVQVTDKRSTGGAEGWKLSAQVTSPFTNKEGAILKNATITYENPFVNSTQEITNHPTPTSTVTLTTHADKDTATPGDSKSFATAEAGKGWGTYTLEFGRPALDENGKVIGDGSVETGATNPTMGKSVKLTVPGNSTLSVKSEYQATITWTVATL